MAKTWELILYALINYVPYILLAMYPFSKQLRFSKAKTASIFYPFLALLVFLFLGGQFLGPPYPYFSAQIILLLSLLFYFIGIKARLGRMLFNVFMIANCANFVVIESKFLEGVFFPSTAGTAYHWTNSVCMLLILVFFAPLLVHVINKYFTKQIRDSINPGIWAALWLIPVFFYALWYYLFYFVAPVSPLEFSYRPSTAVFMLFFMAGQLFIYICIAKLVIQFHQLSLVREEKNRLESQALQYRTIQNQIKETTRIKHDARHHLRTLLSYANAGHYDKLTQYLSQSLDSIPKTSVSYTGNVSLNMLLAYYAQRAEDESICFYVTTSFPEELPLSDSEITVLFGNLLENAFDAAKEMPSSQREVRFTGRFMQNRLIFLIENSYQNEFQTDPYSGSVLSTKHEGYGIGISSCSAIVSDHEGSITFTPGKLFEVAVSI